MLRLLSLSLVSLFLTCGVNEPKLHNVEYNIRKTMGGHYTVWFSDSAGEIVRVENLFGETIIPVKKQRGERIYIKVITKSPDGCLFVKIIVDSEIKHEKADCGPNSYVEIEGYL